jgi:hypothetical protein
MMYQIQSNYFTCGIVVCDGRVTEAAPIVKWMTGRKFSEVQSYCTKKHWKLTMVPACR